MNSAINEDLIKASPVHIGGTGYQPKRSGRHLIDENLPARRKLMVLLAS